MTGAGNPAAAQLAARLAQLWQTSRPTILERMAVLHECRAGLEADAQDREARTRGREAAHKLSGVLGVFGLPQGSELAAAIEHVLQSDQPLGAGDLAALRSQIEELDGVIAAKNAG